MLLHLTADFYPKITKFRGIRPQSMIAGGLGSYFDSDRLTDSSVSAIDVSAFIKLPSYSSFSAIYAGDFFDIPPIKPADSSAFSASSITVTVFFGNIFTQNEKDVAFLNLPGISGEPILNIPAMLLAGATQTVCLCCPCSLVITSEAFPLSDIIIEYL